MATGRLNLISSGTHPLIARLFINKITHTGLVFFDNFKSYFSYKFLFSSGPAEATYGMLPGVGVLYLIQLPFLLIFGYQLITSRNKNYCYLLLLLLLSPIAAALAKGPGLAGNRAAFMVIPLTLMSAIGFGFLAKKAGKLFSVLLLLLLLISAGSYLITYIFKSPVVHAHSMGYGFRQMAQYLSENESGFSQIRISRSLSEPHIYLALYQKTDPRVYQTAAISWADFEKKGFRFLDQYDGYTLGKYRFGDLNYERYDPGNILYVGHPTDFPSETRVKIISLFPDTSPAIVSYSPSD